MQQWQFINNFNQLNMFWAIVSPILRSTRLCLQLVVHCTDDTAGWWHVTTPTLVQVVTCRQPAASSVHYTTSCKHSLVLLRMGETIAQNMFSWLKLLINCHCCIQLVVYINPLTPNVNYSGRTAPLTSKVAFYIFIQQI